MRIVRQSETELVLEESSIWITALLAVAAIPVLYAGTAPGKHGNLATGCFLLLGALVFLRRSRFVFDAGQQQVHWTRLRVFRTTSGEIPFSEISGVNMDCTAGRMGSSRNYRLILVTRSGAVPMADAYSPGRGNCSEMRDAILRFVHLELPAPGRPPRLTAH